MAEYSDLMPEILPHVMSCPVPSIAQAIRSQAQRFFHESQAWIHTFSETIGKGDTSVAISDLPVDTRIVAPLEVYRDKEPMATANHRMLREHYGENFASIQDKPEFLFLADHSKDTFTLAPTSKGAYTISGRAAIKPVRGATGIPDGILDEFADGIIHGTLSRLMEIRNTEWYDPNLAGFHYNAYRAEVDRAQEIARRTNTSRIFTAGYGGI